MRLPGMRIGKSGVEAGMEQELRGEGGCGKIEVDARGRIMRNLEVRDPVGGSRRDADHRYRRSSAASSIASGASAAPRASSSM